MRVTITNAELQVILEHKQKAQEAIKQVYDRLEHVDRDEIGAYWKRLKDSGVFEQLRQFQRDLSMLGRVAFEQGHPLFAGSGTEHVLINNILDRNILEGKELDRLIGLLHDHGHELAKIADLAASMDDTFAGDVRELFSGLAEHMRMTIEHLDRLWDLGFIQWIMQTYASRKSRAAAKEEASEE